ncbi:MAG: SprT-like domain-containing protein [Leptospiraceae bacterium]|nr:SprT-like domain-containing protein [Leptospiraceae bacterium]MBK9503436.1 SprT-like domain-containing protein [Leptospiraceae bacterium]MBL0266592.1 SprT-like domain-containing protein [Leptospiraceae bacterium]MBP6738336.1 SprT-like domain-containing protein [Leptospiraceae bacterium]
MSGNYISKNEKSNSLKEITEEIERLFEVYNKAFFESTLELPIITIQSGFIGRRKSRGWFVNKVWLIDNEKSVNEINLGAEILSTRTPSNIPQIACTLLHEMIHLYNYNRGIQDVTTGGAHSVKFFGRVAEQKGLLVSYDKKQFPFVFTEDLNEDGIRVYNDSNFNESLLDKFRIEFNNTNIGKKTTSKKASPGSEGEDNKDQEETKKKPKQKALFCPACNYSVWVAFGFDKKLRCEGTEEDPCNEILLEKAS